MLLFYSAHFTLLTEEQILYYLISFTHFVHYIKKINKIVSYPTLFSLILKIHLIRELNSEMS